jgi:hypothetical protein
MPTLERLASQGRTWITIGCIGVLAAGLLAVGSFAQSDRPAAAAAPAVKGAVEAVGPDVVVFTLSGVGNYGVSGGYAGYSVGTTSCNRGDAPLNWCDQGSGCAPGAGPEDHPVIAQNLYRLKDGRFQQLGMSWLKHGFVSTNSNTTGCRESSSTGSCQSPPAGGNQLGIGCTDPYGSGLNGSRPLGPKSQVNATTGNFPFPHGGGGYPIVETYDQRIKVATTDLDPTLNPGALYWVEGQYIANDDAAAGNGLNNASHRRVTVGASPTFTIANAAGHVTLEKLPAITSWKAQDATVVMVNGDVPGAIVERFHVARKVTETSPGLWHYEYAVHNLNSDRSARAFTIDFSAAATFSNIGFYDVEHHSGEAYAGTDWSVDTAASQISWSTDTFATNANANALRWASMFNFWFDADQPPGATVQHTIHLFKPGSPTSIVLPGFFDLFGDGFETGNTTLWSGGQT